MFNYSLFTVAKWQLLLEGFLEFKVYIFEFEQIRISIYINKEKTFEDLFNSKVEKSLEEKTNNLAIWLYRKFVDSLKRSKPFGLCYVLEEMIGILWLQYETGNFYLAENG